ncbi:MAG TPA: glycosyltransferase family A protein [Pyrinomonadaceae bacterium]|nr:glycosyltransferase family A protein [Pyrinomonadaceae bacterium]
MSTREVVEKVAGMADEGTAAPAVSVVIPAYNCAAYIAEALDSVFAQTFEDFEVLVVNDGSPDTEELERALAPYRERVVYLRQENRGVSAARNTGIRAARAPLVAFLDADDLWEPFYLEDQLGAMREDPSLAMRYPNTLIFGDVPQAGKTFMEVNPSEGEATIEALMTQRCTVGNSVTARREAVLGAGLFDEELRRSEDFDLWLRILARGGRVGYTRRVLARYRRYAGSLSSDHVEMASDIVRVFDKAERTLGLSGAQLAVLRRERERFHAGLRLQEGKRAFMRGDARAALEALGEANRFFRSRKLSLAMLLIKIAPGLLLRAYDLRDRYVLKAGTRV